MRAHDTPRPQLNIISRKWDVVGGRWVYIAPSAVAGMFGALEFLVDKFELGCISGHRKG